MPREGPPGLQPLGGGFKCLKGGGGYGGQDGQSFSCGKSLYLAPTLAVEGHFTGFQPPFPSGKVIPGSFAKITAAQGNQTAPSLGSGEGVGGGGESLFCYLGRQTEWGRGIQPRGGGEIWLALNQAASIISATVRLQVVYN